MSFKEDFEDTYKVLQRIHNKLTTTGSTASSDVNPLLQDDIVNVLCLLGSPLFSHLVDLDASLSQLSRLSRLSLHLSVDDFELDPTTGELILDRKSEQLVAGMAEDGNITDGKGTLENVDMMMEQLAQGRSIEVVELYKAENGSLGFGVVGLRSELRGELGIFVQEIQPGGIAAKDGRLQDNDQILAINDQLLNTCITHQQAISVLQNARGHVRLLVARTQPSTAATRTEWTTTAATVDDTLKRSDDSLYTRCCRGNEQQQQQHSTTTTDNATLDMVLNTEWIQVEVITLVNDGTGLGFGIIGGKSTGVVVKTILPGGVADRDGRLHSGDHILQIGEINVRGMGSEQVAAVLRQSGTHVHLIVARGVAEPSFDFPPYAPIIPTVQLTDHLHQLNEALLLHGADYAGQHIMTPDDTLEHNTDIILPAEIHTPPAVTVMLEPEVEVFDVELVKDNLGLGITIAGFISDRPTDDLCGIFVRGIIEGSAAALDGRIQIHDQIVAVDNIPLDGFSNQQAVDSLRNTGQVIHLKLARHKFGSKYEQLLQAAASDYVAELNNCNQSTTAATTTTTTTTTTVDVSDVHIIDLDDLLDLPKDVEQLVVNKWQLIVGRQLDIVIAQVCKFKEGGGLGISLEGTVDVEDGVEVHPHHYIRSVLADGPVGLCGQLKAGDELLQVNDSVLYGRNHIEVVTILKDLPRHVRIICARRHDDDLTSTAGHGSALFKAKSEQVLVADNIRSESPAGIIRPSHSLEPLSGLATWASSVITVELQKGERGLGFSILDYQDPLNPTETVIVIRSLVPGGVAQLDGRLIPGDRLMFVNDVHLENATLDEAVQALKGAPHGRVVLGVTKPLPLPEIGESSTDDYLLDEQRLQFNSMSVSIPIFSVNQTKSIYGAEMSPLNSSINHIESQPLTDVQSKHVDTISSNNQPPSTIVYELEGLCYRPVDRQPLVELSDVSTGSTTKLKAAYRSPSLVESVHNPPSQLVRRNQEEELGALVPAVKSVTGSCAKYQPSQQTESLPDVNLSASRPARLMQQDFAALPASLERTITIHKGTDALGMIVESVEGGVNGCVVKSLVDTDAVAKDGRIHVGDCIVSVNGESLRRVSNVQARAILRRSSVISSDILITFISSADISGKHEDSVTASSCQTTSVDINVRLHSLDTTTAATDHLVSVGPPNHSRPSHLANHINTNGRVPSLPTSPTSDTLPSVPTSPSAGLPPAHVLKSGVLLPSPATDKPVSPTVDVVSCLPAVSSKDCNADMSTVINSSSSNIGSSQILDHLSQRYGIPLPGDILYVQLHVDNSLGRVPAAGCRLGLQLIGRPNTTEHVTGQPNLSSNKTSPVIGRFSVEGSQSDHVIGCHNNTLGVYIAGILPGSIAAREGSLRVGDQLLQVNNEVLLDCNHLTASTLIKSLLSSYVNIVLFRRYTVDTSLQSVSTECTQNIETCLSNTTLLSTDATSLLNNNTLTQVSTMCVSDTVSSPSNYSSVPLTDISTVSLDNSHSNRTVPTNSHPTSTVPENVLSNTVPLKLLSTESSEQNDTTRLNGTVPLDTDDSTTLCVVPLEPSVVVLDGNTANPEVLPSVAISNQLLSVSADIQGNIVDKNCVDTLQQSDDNVNTPLATVNNHHRTSVSNRTKRSSVSNNMDHTLSQVVGLSERCSGQSTSGTPLTDASVHRSSKSTRVDGVDRKHSETGADHKVNIKRKGRNGARSHPAADEAGTLTDPKTCPVVCGRETVIEIDKGLHPLGVDVIGGASTLLGVIVIHEIFEGGVAARDGRLQVGDEILEVNDEDFRCDVTDEWATEVLRQTPGLIRLVVYRDAVPIVLHEDNDFYEVFTLDLIKKPGKGLGFSIVGRQHDNSGIFISDVIKGGVADVDGQLVPGDQILVVNGIDIRNSSQQETAALLKTLMGRVSLTIGRVRCLSRSSSTSSLSVDSDDDREPHELKTLHDVDITSTRRKVQLRDSS